MENVLSLIQKANDDVELAKAILKKENLHDQCGYSLAQAVEKLLKGLILIHDQQYPREKQGHNLVMLFDMADRLGLTYLAEFDDLIRLEVYGAASRYDYTAAEERVRLPDFLERVEKLQSTTRNQMLKKLRNRR